MVRPMSTVDVAGYLDRLGLVHPSAPSIHALARLHRAHVELVPYETLDIHLGRATSVDPHAAADRIVGRQQGGYCFHLNGAFAVLLSALGYRVTWHRSGVQRRTDPAPVGANANHLGLTVRLGAERWIVDVGLGDALYEPIPLRWGTYAQGPFAFTLRPSEVEAGGWRLDHDPRGGFTGVDVAPAAAGLGDFAAQHTHLSTSPDSSFVRVMTALRRHAEGVDALRGCLLTQVFGDATTSITVDKAVDWFGVLADLFGLTLGDVPPAERDALWRKVYGSHEAWEAAGRP